MTRESCGILVARVQPGVDPSALGHRRIPPWKRLQAPHGF